jgi:hypothetical protein
MTQTQITQRIAQFERVVKANAKEISELGNAAWIPIKETTETPTIRAFLTKSGVGVDYLNRNLASLLSKNGRVVKFAGLFLHGTPMVRGWTKNEAGKKKPISGDCELADLMTVFLYVDRNKAIKRMRSVMFQAKMQQSKGAHVVEDPEQRKLYDECEGFDYINATVSTKGDGRTLPKGASRKKALQFMFVEPRPVETRTIPSDKGKCETLGYGDHLVNFLNGETGFKSDTKRSAWGKIVWELMEKMASQVYSDNMIKGPGIQGVLNHFNSFENHDVWCINEGQTGEGFGVQLVIVWDGDIPEVRAQVQTLPKIPVKKLAVPVTPAKEYELEIEIEKEMQALERSDDLAISTCRNLSTP